MLTPNCIDLWMKDIIVVLKEKLKEYVGCFSRCQGMYFEMLLSGVMGRTVVLNCFVS